MNWAVLKDAKWWSLTATSLLLGFIGIVLAVYNNSYWAYFVIISVIFTFLGANRGDELSGL